MIALPAIRRGLLAAVCCLILASPAMAFDLIDLRGGEAIGGDVAAGKAKSETCVACHGTDGISPIPMFPNLAGQPAAYAYWQLVAFKQAARPESPMTALVSTLSDEDFRDLSAYYATLSNDVPSATPLPPVDPEVLAHGESLYAGGSPERGIPACQGCHGIHGEGAVAATGAAAAWPHLRGQQGAYLTQKLQKYRDGVEIDSTQDRIMQAVARSLDEQDIQALSGYLASLRPVAGNR